MERTNRGVSVVVAGTGINLALGVLYAWSIFKEAIKASIAVGGEGAFAWEAASVNDPYAVACLVFAFAMIAAGRMQDSLGPRITALLGGVLVSLGLLWVSQSVNYWVWVAGFGGLVGMGIAFGYAAATPAALKWFSPAKSGLIAGIVVAGFGLASAYIAPLATWLVGNHGLLFTMQFFGLAFLLVVSLFSRLLVVPPATAPVSAAVAAVGVDRDDVLKDYKFWLLWAMYFIGAGAGLMVIGSISGMAKLSMGESAFLAVAILAVGNASGRVLAGVLSDRLGRSRVLAGIFLFQAVLMFLAVYGMRSGSAFAIVLLATLIGFNYGANLTLFPSFAKHMWGMRRFGVNYGMLFTAWGVGGFVMTRLGESLKEASGSYDLPFLVAGLLLLLGFAISLRFQEHAPAAPRPAVAAA